MRLRQRVGILAHIHTKDNMNLLLAEINVDSVSNGGLEMVNGPLIPPINAD